MTRRDRFIRDGLNMIFVTLGFNRALSEKGYLADATRSYLQSLSHFLKCLGYSRLASMVEDLSLKVDNRIEFANDLEPVDLEPFVIILQQFFEGEVSMGHFAELAREFCIDIAENIERSMHEVGIIL